MESVDTTGLAYCEVCRVVVFCPSQIADPHLDEVQRIRMLLSAQTFAYCPVCKRTQVFTHLDKDKD
jgi:hypothetical protein